MSTKKLTAARSIRALLVSWGSVDRMPADALARYKRHVRLLGTEYNYWLDYADRRRFTHGRSR